jgi:hypothetical protein
MTLIERIRTLALDPHRATDMARFGPFPSFTPAMKSVVTNCEKRLGFALPTFLRRLYLEVGNGGFGPGYGLLGIGKNGSHDDLDRDLVPAGDLRRSLAIHETPLHHC